MNRYTYIFLACSILILCQCSKKSGLVLPDKVDFNYHVRPILSQNCYTCHGPEPTSRKANLRLDTYDGATSLLPNNHYAIVPGKPARSSIIERISSSEGDLVMPPPESKKKLTPYEIALISKWIEQGAEWKKHWSFIPLETKNSKENTIDQFIKEDWEKLELIESAKADKNTLIRRISYTLTGLPPTIYELEKLLIEDYESIVDHYISSEHYGEHWARHWMDLVRYGEKMGHEWDFRIGGAWRYRDYLIRAFNNDVAYDQFVKEHLAGDMLDQPRINEDNALNESVIGTAYAVLGEGKHSPVDVKLEEADRIDNMIDVTSKTFLGLTVSCAKCHDHKFDPIPTTDYYAMYGMFESSRISPVFFSKPENKEEIFTEIEEINKQVKEKLKDFTENIDLKKEKENRTVIADFTNDHFGKWYNTGEAFGGAPLHGKSASSAFYGKGLSGVLRSPNFEIQDSFIYVYGAGHESTVRVIVDNFQLIQNPLYGNLSQEIDNDTFKLYKMNVSMLSGHKAYIEIMPGKYDRHEYQINIDDYIDVKYVLSSDDTILGTPMISELGKETVNLLVRKDSLSSVLFDTAYVMGLTEGDAVQSPVFIRGSHQELSEDAVPHGFIEVISGKKAFDQSGSGRMQWAEEVVDPRNPLTARVMVNRIWHHLFGKGIVETVDNFGMQGTLPSHPELLDYLATKFIEDGWSIKHLIKRIMMSEVFQLSTEINPKNAKKDPTNKFLASFPIRRLEAESIRDGLLATSGSLKREMYGESTPLELTEFMSGRGRPEISGPLDGDGRRSIYLEINRNFLSPFLLAFDMPIPFSTYGKRNTTNVPAQSLILMNDPFVHEQAENWAREIIEMKDKSLEEKIIEIYNKAYARDPSIEEIKDSKDLLTDITPENSVELWKNFCHIIFNTKEFIFLI